MPVGARSRPSQEERNVRTYGRLSSVEKRCLVTDGQLAADLGGLRTLSEPMTISGSDRYSEMPQR